MIYGRAFTADDDERFLERWSGSLSSLPMDSIFEMARGKHTNFVCGDFHFAVTGAGYFQSEFGISYKGEIGAIVGFNGGEDFLPVYLYMTIIGHIIYFSVQIALSNRRRIIFVYSGGERGLSLLPDLDPIIDHRFSYSTKAIWLDHQGKLE